MNKINIMILLFLIKLFHDRVFMFLFKNIYLINLLYLKKKKKNPSFKIILIFEILLI
jgi:hypothetical protein